MDMSIPKRTLDAERPVGDTVASVAEKEARSRVSDVPHFQPMTPIVIAAVKALCEFEEWHILQMAGYDLIYAQEDLPRVVKDAIAGWASV
jgi:hypothetical protein